jgi:hypothetical protein
MVLKWLIFKIVSGDPDLYPRTIHAMFALNWPTSFQRRRLLNNFPIGSYVKTMSVDSGYFGSRSGSLDTILEVDHLRTIDDMFAILTLLIFKIVSGDPDLHPRWSPPADIFLT